MKKKKASGSCDDGSCMSKGERKGCVLCALIILALGIAYLLDDIGKIVMPVQPWTIVFLAIGVHGLVKACCKK